MRGRQAALACRRPRDYPRAPMETFAPPARALVAHMIEDAERHPERTVAFQGAPGANSHVAVRQAFPDGLPLPCFDFADAIEAVQDGSADCAMIPIENSLHGRVADIHFLLPESGLVIVGEYFLPIRYALMGLERRADIRQATSPPRAMGPCAHSEKARGSGPGSPPPHSTQESA